jgi:hypothetical protein
MTMNTARERPVEAATSRPRKRRSFVDHDRYYRTAHTTPVSTAITALLRDRLKAIAVERGTTPSELIREALEEKYGADLAAV